MTQKRVWNSNIAQILSYKATYKNPAEIVSEMAINFRKALRIVGPIKKIEEVCAVMNIDVAYDVIDFDSILTQKINGYCITVNQNHNKNRQRFSIAHEIGHIELFKETGLSESFGDTSISKERNNCGVEVEELCDYFASELLMPSNEWKSLIYQEGISITKIKNLCGKYKVSFFSGVRKVTDLNIWKCAVILWEPTDDILSLERLNAKNFFCKEKIGNVTWPHSILVSENLNIPGSPVFTLLNEKDSEGKVSLKFLELEINSFVQSSIIRSNPLQAATIIIVEGDPEEIILRTDTENKVQYHQKRQLKFYDTNS